MTATPLTHRRSHRRTRLAVLALTALTLGVGAPASAGASVPAERVGATRPAHVLGHDGAGKVDLGDGARAIRAAGGQVLGRPGAGCRGFVLPGRERQSHRTDGYLAPGLGVVAVFARSGMRTPEGVHVGSTLAAVEAAYPQLRKGADVRTAELSEHVDYTFVVTGRRVTEIGVVDDRQPCFG